MIGRLRERLLSARRQLPVNHVGSGGGDVGISIVCHLTGQGKLCSIHATVLGNDLPLAEFDALAVPLAVNRGGFEA